MNSLAFLNPFRYHVSEIVKALVAFIGFAGYTAAIFITVPTGFTGSVAALIVPAAGAITVFAWGNHEASAFNKAFVGLISASITVANYWAKLSPSLESKLYVAAGGLAMFLGILFAKNAPIASRSRRLPKAAGHVPAHRTQHR